MALGIDLGTTNSVVAVARGGGIEVVPTPKGQRLHPSVVAFKPSGEVAVGLSARLRRVIDPRNTIFSVKRLMGRPFGDRALARAIEHLPYRVVEGPDMEPLVVTRGGQKSPVEISSMVLAHLRQLAEEHVGHAIGECVVTVPANFNDGQREATRRAAAAAGFEVLRVLNEPTAAALAHGMGRKLDQRVAVFDMGGGTFDLTVLAVRGEVFEVLATGGDPFLGGDDMDHVLAEMLAQQFLEQHRIDLRAWPDAYALLLIAAEQIKAKLSSEDEASGTLNELAHGPGGAPLSLDFCVTRAELEARIDPLVERAMELCEMVLAEAGVSAHNVDEVVLVGGTTRVPLVRRRVADAFGRTPRADLDPMEVVARGAALQAAALLGQDLASPQPGAEAGAVELELAVPLLVDVTPHALGLATAGGYTDILIDKNEKIPAERTRLFTTARDDQRDVVLRVCQGGERAFEDNTLLGELRLSDLPAGRRGEVKIEVTFLVDADGILQVSARDPATGRAERATLRVHGLGGDR